MSERATDSDCLETRSAGNRLYAGADFDGWVQSLLAPLAFASVLDMCCGTGNQLMLYAARPGVERLVGVDISGESLDRARARLAEAKAAERVRLECVPMDDAFARPAIGEARFDLASCFYGLYYAADPLGVLDRMIDRLSERGAILVVGPWGRNNAALFDLLDAHFELPAAVLASARTFMEETVLPAIDRRLALETRTFVNPVRYPDARAVLDYWRASTFYDASHEPAVARSIEARVAEQGDFVLEKHVMAALGRKET